ncbi:MAG: hypothetical protein Kow0067_17760 [Coriobacteriia bacterium]
MTKYARARARTLDWIRAAFLAAFIAGALVAMPFFPTPLIAALALATGAIALFSPSLAALFVVIVAGIPVLAADFVVGILFLIVGLAATQYLTANRAEGFLVIAAAVLAVVIHAEWGVAVLAGYLLGSASGAVTAAIACLLIEAAGLLLGIDAIGTLSIGGTSPGVLAFTSAPDAALGFGWLGSAVAAAEPGRVLDALLGARDAALLAAQPLIWAGGAIIGGFFRKPGAPQTRAVLGTGLGVLAVGSVSYAALVAAGQAPSVGLAALTAGVSLLVAVAVTAASEWVFTLAPVPPVPATTTAPPAHGLRTEDADVDELLGVIASAEDELVTKHTTEAVVLITDMKSFSRMTEEVGSVESAKIVQRHRDLLLPLVDRHGGAGKSTGGDGLVAAFGDPADAIAAAAEMQRRLTAFAEEHELPATVAVRIGIARGEVVLDRSGRPFLGAALNLAARIMDLADGGRILAEKGVGDASGCPRLHDHGAFRLKNIRRPVDVVEVLWADDMEPMAIARDEPS